MHSIKLFQLIRHFDSKTDSRLYFTENLFFSTQILPSRFLHFQQNLTFLISFLSTLMQIMGSSGRDISGWETN